MHAAILLIGGKGERFLDPQIPKQFQRLSGKRVFEYALHTFLQTNHFHQILLPCHPEWIEPLKKELYSLSPKIRLLEGGNSRQESVYKALKFLEADVKKVVIHDGARPFVNIKMIEDLLEALDEYEVAGTYIQSADTIGATDGYEITSIPNRTSMVRGQTPQALRKNTLFLAHEMALDQNIATATCDVQLALKIGKKVKIVEGHEINIKITTPVDMYIAEHLLRKCIHPTKKPLDLNRKRILLIGASGGIGQKIHQELLHEGAEVIPLSRTTSPISIDLNHEASIIKACQDLKKSFDSFDGCIFCAGKLCKGSIETISLKEVEEMTRINFTSLIPLLQNIPLKKGGIFILIGSSSYYRGRKEIGVYSATKAASINLIQSLAEERPDLDLQVFCPKRTNTPMRRKNFPLEDPSDLAEPLEVAKTILKELKSHLGKGEVLNVF